MLDRYCPLTKHGFPDLVPDRSSCTPVRIAQWCLLRGKINRSNVRPLLRKVRRHRINSALIFVDLFSIICANQVKSYGEHCNGSLKTVAGVSNSHCKTISSYQWILLRREDNENEESRVILALSMKTTSNVQQILRFGENEFTFNIQCFPNYQSSEITVSAHKRLILHLYGCIYDTTWRVFQLKVMGRRFSNIFSLRLPPPFRECSCSHIVHRCFSLNSFLIFCEKVDGFYVS